MMTSGERVMGAVNRTGYDRIPVKHEGTPEIDRMLMDYFGLTNHEQLLRVLGSDFRYVEPVYTGPELRTFPDGSIEGYFGERYRYAEFEGGKYLEASYLPYAGIETLDQLDRSHFPSADWFDYSAIRPQCEKLTEQGVAICCGTAGDMDFINSIARCRGTEQVLIDLIEDNEVYLAIMDARFEFFYEQHRRMLEAAGGLIDFAHVGDDLGSQTGPMISPDIFERHFAAKYKKYFDMVHSYGARSKMHMCGCVHSFLPRLTELGLDVYDVVQPTTPEMDIAVLKKKHGNKLIFCGTVCVQSTIAFGTPADVEREVKRRLELFKDGGLFIGPTHAIQVGSPPENILTLYRTAGSLTEKEDIGADILSIQGSGDEGKISRSKLF
ncbi:MAG: uroporphyrinogen decarboxylase family protein [Kiritimatiellales bacterium]